MRPRVVVVFFACWSLALLALTWLVQHGVGGP